MNTGFENGEMRVTAGSAKRAGLRSFSPAWTAFALLCAFWIIFLCLTTPNLAGTDVYIFRDPGCNLAQGNGFVSRSVPHNAFLIPARLFASYTPGGPFVYALFAKFFGCSGYADTFYDLLLHIVLYFLLLGIFLGYERRPAARLAIAVALGVLVPLDPVDRPDSLIFPLLVVLLLLWNRSQAVTARVAILAGSGVVFLIYPYAGILSWMAFAFLLIFSGSEHPRLRIFVTGAVISAALVAGCALYMHHLDSTVIHQFMRQAFGVGTGAGAILRGQTEIGRSSQGPSGYSGAFHHVFNLANPLSGLPLIELLLVFLIILVFAVRRPKLLSRRRDLVQFTSLLLVLFVFPLALFPKQPKYFAISFTVLLVLVLVGRFSLAEELRKVGIPYWILAIWVLSAVPWLAIELIRPPETHVSYQHAVDQAKRVRQIFAAQGYNQPRMIVDADHFFIYKPYFQNMYDLSYLEEEASNTDAFQGLALCYMATHAFDRSQMTWPAPLKPADWRPIDLDDDAVPIKLFGHRIMRRNWAWTCDVYEHR